MSEFEKGLANVMGSFMEVNLDCVEKQNQEIEQLQQENKQLKTTNESLTSLVNSCQKEIRKYKEVIEEVREVINTYKYVENDDGMYEPILDGYDIQKLLQILDKGVKNE